MSATRITVFHRRGQVFSRLSAVTCVLTAGCISAPLATPRRAVANDTGAPENPPPLTHDGFGSTFDPAVPTPASVIGHAMGDGAVRYEPAMRYLKQLAAASPYVIITPYAKTHEGRTLHFLTISSQANLSRLDAIKADNAKLADPRKLSSADEADRILNELPGIAWLAYAIHGDELSSTDAAVQLAYQLAAGTDPATKRLRDELVIHIDPMMNPDGRERYLGQLQTLVGKVENSDYQAMQHSGLWSAGRGNHYLFDLNRDWLMQVHPETRGRAAKILEWNPHLVVDSHEMGPLDTYLFDPPREPISVYLSKRTLAWRRRFSADQARAFDAHGWSYYTREWYEEWYPGYTNSWTSLQGSIGLLYEQAGVDGAAVRQGAGNLLTYRDAVHHHFVSSLANLESLRANRADVLRDFFADRKWAVKANGPGPSVLIIPPPTDRARFVRFADLLHRHGIETAASRNDFIANDVTDIWRHHNDSKKMPGGSLIVRLDQPRRRLIQALLQFDPHMSESFLVDERKDLEKHRGTRVYDITAWNLCMAYGLTAYWAGRIEDVATGPPTTAAPIRSDRKPGFGYLIDGADGDVYRAVIRLLNAGCKTRIATEPFTIGGHAYERGAVLLRNNENAGDLHRAVRDAVADLDVDVRGTDTALCEDGPDLGGRRFGLLEKPRIALASQFPIATTSFGATWFLLDARIGLRVSPINVQRLGRMDLRSYNVIVLPHAWSSPALAAILNKTAIKRLRSWIESGGTLIAVGGSAAFLANKERGLSSVRLRRDVLDELAVYEEALRREQAANNVDVDPVEVWDATPVSIHPADTSAAEAKKKDDKASKPGAKRDVEALKRKDAFQRLFSPSGAMVRATLDEEHWLCSGVASSDAKKNVLPVLMSGTYAFLSKFPVQTPVRLADAESLRLSGLLWKEARERLAETAYVTVERVGNGQIILFASDPFFRGYTEATGRLLLNAMLYGPGLGASQTVPWD